MRILSIIAEYNPFHFGHEYHLKKSIENTDSDIKVAIISGNFVQRGEPSILNKWEKADIALKAGFDLVIELPTIYAISSAENFANGAIRIADSIQSNFISFGSECGDLEKLKSLSKLINENEEKYTSLVKERIAQGYSYPKSQEMAIFELFGKEYKDVCKSNNILGLEYLKALTKINSSTIPLTIEREINYSSSSLIRENIKNNSISSLKSLEVIPEFAYQKLIDNYDKGSLVLSLKCYEKELFYILRSCDLEYLNNIPDIPENMMTNLKKATSSTNSLESLIEILKNKSITQARIQRILLYILLGITKDDMKISKELTPYVRVLGVNENGKKALSTISKIANVITSVKDFEDNCKDKKLLRLLEIDKKATDIYTLAYTGVSKANLDYTTRLIVKN